MVIPHYASFRSQPPSGSFSVSAIAGNLADETRNYYLSYANRAGRSLLSDPITVTSTGVQVTFNSYLADDEIFWLILSYETTGNPADAGIIYQWKAREDDQTTRRSLPVTIDFTLPSHFINNRAVQSKDVLPTTDILPGAIAYSIDDNLYYRYDPEAVVDGNGRLTSYGAFANGVGNWIEYGGTFAANVSEVGGTGSSDINLSSAIATLKAPPKINNNDSTPIRYAIANGFLNDGGTQIDTGKFTFDISVDGADYTSVFANKIKFILLGYKDRNTGVLDNSIATVGEVKVWNPVDGFFELPEPLIRNHEAILDVYLSFGIDELLGLLPKVNSEIQIDIVEVLNIVGKVSEVGRVIGDLVFSDRNKFLILPGLKRLSGIASFAEGYLADDKNEQVIAGLQADTPGQRITITGALNGFARVKQAGEQLADSEKVRAIVSTESGITKLVAALQITLSNQGFTVTLTNPVTADGAGIIRSDYGDIWIRGNQLATFTPSQAFIFANYNGSLFQSQPLPVGALQTQTFTFTDLNTFTAIASLPVQADADFSLFEPVSLVADASTGTLTGNLTVFIGYNYPSPNNKATKILHDGVEIIPTLNSSMAEAINNSLIRSQNFADVIDIAAARDNIDVHPKAIADTHIADLANPHQVTRAQIDAVGQSEIGTAAARNTGINVDEIPLLENNGDGRGKMPGLPLFSVTENSNFVATPNILIKVDTSSGVVEVTFPAGLQINDWFWFTDKAGSDRDSPTGFGENSLVLKFGDYKFQGYSEDLIVDTENAIIKLQFDGVDNLNVVGGQV